MRKLTPILVVDAIEPVLPFWTEALGFDAPLTVPHGDTLGFAILQKGDIEVMLQTRASIEADLGASGAPADLGRTLSAGRALLFIEVDGIDELLPSLESAEVVVPRRRTDYGMDEIFVRAPCGTVVGFAARVAEGG